MNKLTVVAISCFLISGCSVKSHFMQSDSQIYKASDYKAVRVYALEKPSFKYIVLGSVTADTAGDGDAAIEVLREQAAEMGANAVIRARLTKVASYASRTGITGIAVRAQ